MPYRSMTPDDNSLVRRVVLAGPLLAVLQGCARSDGQVARAQAPPSAARTAVLHAQAVVTGAMLGPTDAARLYAYATRTFRDVQALNGDRVAVASARYVTDVLTLALPTEARPGGLQLRDVPTPSVPTAARTAVREMVERAATDGREDASPPRPRPAAGARWSPTAGVEPTTPGAGAWRRWYPRTDGDPVPPPEPGTDRDRAECEAVRDAVSARTPSQEERIRFWRAGPGSVTPSGMWLDIADRLLRRTAISLSEPDVLTLLATATSDAAGTCWQLKYTHWTARPSQRIPGLRMANADPPFPAYPSGHSTMSRAAAEVLGAVFPRSADALLAAAREARDTRLQAGVHFPVDNDAGFVIGAAVARSALAAARLS